MSNELVADLFRRESGRLIALLSARVGAGRIDMVEDAVQEALVAAMRRWPLHGVPANPSGWLYTAARNALSDRLRRGRLEIALAPEHEPALDAIAPPSTRDEPWEDELLRLILFCCHPSLAQGAQLALTLRLACGLGVEEIASVLLTTPASIAQRIVRAKVTLRERAVEFDLPGDSQIVRERLPGVLNAVYLLFDAGYLSARHDEWLRPALCADALRLARLLAATAGAAQPETFALAALLCFSAARLPAREDTAGRPIPLAEQDRSRWDGALIAEGFAHFEKSIGGEILTRYHIEAAIAAIHARSGSFAATDWSEILGCYDQLCALYPSPVASLNRIIALRHARGAPAAWAALASDPSIAQLEESMLYHATVATLHEALGEAAQAAQAYLHAAAAAGSSTLAELFRARARSVSTQNGGATPAAAGTEPEDLSSR